jgi:hypothetical protein
MLPHMVYLVLYTNDFVLAKNHQMARQFFENRIFYCKFLVSEENNSPKSDKTLVFWGWCGHIYAY